MSITIYETYDYHTKSLYWWSGRDKSTNCFEIRKGENKYHLYVNEIYHSSYEEWETAIKVLESMYDNGTQEKYFRILRYS